MESTSVVVQSAVATSGAGAVSPATRLLSLDVFRGMTMASMVVVNNPGDWGRPWDPEGLVSTLPAVGTAVLGCVAGLCLGSGLSRQRKTLLLAFGGVALTAVGLAWNPVFPINKNLWTSSYVAFPAGTAALLLAACYWLIDVRGWRGWARPFEVLGLNAIALYVLSALLAKFLAYVRVGADGGATSLGAFIYSLCYEPIASPRNASLLFALTHLAVLFGVLLLMYRKRLFLKL